MKQNGSIIDDPVVAEVRAIRAQIWKEAGGTIEGLLASLQRERQNDATLAKRKPRRRPSIRRRAATRA